MQGTNEPIKDKTFGKISEFIGETGTEQKGIIICH
jgi:hypothetical protein